MDQLLSVKFVWAIALRIGLAACLWLAGIALYRVWLHPLASYPGPLLAKMTGFYTVYHAWVGDLHLDMLRCHQKYGQSVRYGPNKIIVRSSQAIQDIYSRTANVQKSTAYRAFETSPNALDLQSTVDKVAHKRKRRVISQAFSDSALRSLEEHALLHIDTFIAHLSEPEGQGKLDSKSTEKNIATWCNYLSFDLMSELVFGRTFNMLETADNRYIIDLIQYAAFRVGVCLQMPALALWNVDKIVTPSIRSLRDRYVKVSKRMAVDRMNMEGKRQDLFSHILAARDPDTGVGFSTNEIWGESTLLIVAGSDAISTAMAGCFFYLSTNEKAHLKARDEVRSAFTSREEIRNNQTLASCDYLYACIDEAMRMSPPVGGALWREVCEGGCLIDGSFVPKGYDVGVGIYAIHHDEAYFSSPFEFIPERWIESPDNSKEAVARMRRAFTAFSIGPVGCVGKNLAYMELALTMARVLWSLDLEAADAPASKSTPTGYLRRYKEHASHEYRLRDRFTSWKDGPMLKFHKRQPDNPKD